MTDKKPENTTDDARVGPDADKNREELVKKAEDGMKDAKGELPKGEV